ncbi:MAG: hypothetical protein DVB31_13030 [Verrucomicrobia bacterium]|nr:MAG: hypothetical protein DVB31_13030 [Verrucomicrobiota bacterium]
MNLSQIGLALGMAHGVAGLLAFLRPAAVGPWLQRFPRRVAPGVFLMLGGTAWFVWNLYSSDLSDFAEWRPIMYAGSALLGIGCCFFVQDFLAVRGACVVALLGCDRILDVQRIHDSPWRVVVAGWCYAVIVLAVWWVQAPWRVRDLAAWLVAMPERLKRIGMGIAAFGILLTGLALTQFR